jgi:uncharacterized protein (DUF2062 family)
MPRKFFRKYLPSHEAILGHRWLGRFGRFLGHPNLWHLNRNSVAGGFAVGLLSGLVPGPLQMLTALLIAIPLHVNLPVALLTTLYTNPFTIVPLYLLAYAYGSLLLGGNGQPAAIGAFEMDWLHLGDSMVALAQWMVSLGPRLGVGLVALGLTLAGIGYFAVQVAWRTQVSRAWRARAKRRAAGTRP